MPARTSSANLLRKRVASARSVKGPTHGFIPGDGLRQSVSRPLTPQSGPFLGPASLRGDMWSTSVEVSRKSGSPKGQPASGDSEGSRSMAGEEGGGGMWRETHGWKEAGRALDGKVRGAARLGFLVQGASAGT